MVKNLYYDQDDVNDNDDKKLSSNPKLLKKIENPYYGDGANAHHPVDTLTSPESLESSTVIKTTENVYYEEGNISDTLNVNYIESDPSSTIVKNVENPYYE